MQQATEDIAAEDAQQFSGEEALAGLGRGRTAAKNVKADSARLP